jgi:two-component system, LytTR family, sensor kinase
MFSHRLRYFFAGLLGIYSFLNIYFLDGDRLYAVKLDAFPLLIVILVLTFAVWFCNLLIQLKVVNRVGKLHPLITQFSISTVLMLVISFASAEITGLILSGPFKFSFQNFLLTLAFTSRINLFLNSLNAIFFFNEKLKEKAIEAERLKSLNSEAKLESINSQLNPHFFFNNLSALSVLIHKDVQLADRYLLKLSEVYRYILKNRGNELVSLQEEMDFLSHYLELLSIRFEDSLKFSVDIKSACYSKLLPPAVLQLLVENVVKHNYFTRKKPMEVRLFCEEGILKMHNPKQPKPAIEPSSGIGLQNISDRYRFLNFEIKVIDHNEFFQVELPLIDEQKITFGRG